MIQIAQHATLPALRQDLGVFSAPAEQDGSPVWHLHDPAANRFYRMGWAAFEILSRWSLGTPAAILQSIHQETTLTLTTADVEGVLQFLQQNFLIEARTAHDSQYLLKYQQSKKLHWSKWLLKNYLFFRIPLVQPDTWLQRITPWFNFVFQPLFWLAMFFSTLFALYLVWRDWDVFSHSFAAYRNWQGLLAFGIALSFSKIIHELGHAITTRHHGCQVPAMGVAFLVLWPVLYTDTTEAWKLSSRRARLQIGIAGIAAELCLAVAATYLWFMLPEGPIRAAVFFIATSTWLITIAINASPFMRFDGYFLLSDLLSFPNLHSRSFALGRWWLRECLFGLKQPPPEHHTSKIQRFLIVFAFATWLYRLLLFLSIALLVYHFFFKALGIFLMLVEVGWFILRPLAEELNMWFKIRHQLRWNAHTLRTMIVLLVCIAAIILPWQNQIRVPAVLSPAREQAIYASMPAQIRMITSQSKVKQGDILVTLSSPELSHRIQLAQQKEAHLNWKLNQQNFSTTLLRQGDALKEHWQEARAELNGLLAEQEKLTIRAPFDGSIMIRNDEISVDSWVSPKEMLLMLADTQQVKIEAFVEEQDFDRLSRNHTARFIADIGEIGRIDCLIHNLDTVNLSELEETSLAAQFGGQIATHTIPPINHLNESQPTLRPIASLYRVQLQSCTPNQPPPLKTRGIAVIEADAQNLFTPIMRQIMRSLFREGGM